LVCFAGIGASIYAGSAGPARDSGVSARFVRLAFLPISIFSRSMPKWPDMDLPRQHRASSPAGRHRNSPFRRGRKSPPPPSFSAVIGLGMRNRGTRARLGEGETFLPAHHRRRRGDSRILGTPRLALWRRGDFAKQEAILRKMIARFPEYPLRGSISASAFQRARAPKPDDSAGERPNADAVAHRYSRTGPRP